MTSEKSVSEKVSDLKELYSDIKNDVTDHKIQNAEMRSLISDVNSAVMRNMSQSNTLEVTVVSQKSKIEALEKEVSEMKSLFQFMKRQLFRVIGIFVFIIVCIIILVAAVVINGKIVHYETGLDETDVEVFQNSS